jgi:transcriptional regulator EpsA
MLSEEEQDRLIRAIESAIEVNRQDRFHAWLRGPFRALLPHDIVVCVELRVGGDALQIDCLHHNPLDADAMDVLCNPEHGLAIRLAKSYRADRRQSCTVDANALEAMLCTDGRRSDQGLLHNVVIHRIKLLSGASYSFVLVNVPHDQLDRCRQLFRLVSSHLKMALSRTIAKHDRKDVASLTRRELEILQLMGKGKSNREISAMLGISAITLKSHVSKLYRKLDVQNRAEAVSRGLSSPVSPQPV